MCVRERDKNYRVREKVRERKKTEKKSLEKEIYLIDKERKDKV